MAKRAEEIGVKYTGLRVELFGTPFLDLKDFAFGTIGMIVAGLVVSVTAGWFADEAIVRETVGDRSWTVRVLLAALRFFIPTVLTLNLAVRMLSGV